MALVKLKPDVPSPVVTTTPETIAPPVKSNFTALIPENRIKSLLKYVEGYPWTVDYYGQLLNTNNTLNHFDPGLVDLVQSYYLVNKAIIQVSSPLSASYDEEEGLMKASGSAIVPLGIRPNVGDIFLAQVDTGEDALFVVNSAVRKSHRKEALYEIDYELFAYTTDEPEFLDKLSKRVNERYFFNPDTDYFNRDVLIKPSVKEAMDRLQGFVKLSQEYYFATFSQDYSSSLLLPGTTRATYDPLLADFIMKTVDVSSISNNRFYRHTLQSKDLERPSILDSLLTRTPPHPRLSESKYKFVSATELPVRSRLGTLSYTGVDYVLYPLEPLRDHIAPHREGSKEVFSDDILNQRNYDNSTFPVSLTSNNNEVYSKAVLHELFKDDSYIVTEGFYNYMVDHENYSEISYTELMIYKFIHRVAISKEDLAIAVQEWRNWSLMHQFYLLPVYWLIARNV